MSRNTDARINANLMDLDFKELLEEARRMVQQGKKGDAAYHVLQHMNLTKDKNKNNPILHHHIPDRQLAEMLGMPNPERGGKSVVWGQRDRLKREREGTEKVLKNVDTSQMKYIGSGNQFVYLYYFPAYRRYYELFLQEPEPYWPCNIGKTIGDVKNRVSEQIGQQLPEKAKIALVIKTNDCDALEMKIHNELKKIGCWLDPNLDNGAVGVEWFLTNPTEVERIFKSIDEKLTS